jgi:hypothetical protein
MDPKNIMLSGISGDGRMSILWDFICLRSLE